MPQIRLTNGMVIRFEAREPDSNGDVGGVTVSRVAIYGASVSGGGAFDMEGLLPLLTPTTNDVGAG